MSGNFCYSAYLSYLSLLIPVRWSPAVFGPSLLPTCGGCVTGQLFPWGLFYSFFLTAHIQNRIFIFKNLSFLSHSTVTLQKRCPSIAWIQAAPLGFMPKAKRTLSLYVLLLVRWVIIPQFGVLVKVKQKWCIHSGLQKPQKSLFLHHQYSPNRG